MLARGARLIRRVRDDGWRAVTARLAPQWSAARLGARLPFSQMNAEDAVETVWSAEGGLVRPAQVRRELDRLAAVIAADRPRVVLEIGTHHGGTLLLWCLLAADDAMIMSVDLPDGPFGGGYPVWREALYHRFPRPHQKLRLCRGDSHAPGMCAEVVQALGHRPIDLLFLDGDHTAGGVEQDWTAYAPLVRDGGLIVFHDIADHGPDSPCQVRPLWRALTSRYATREIIADPRQGWAGIGLLTYRREG